MTKKQLFDRMDIKDMGSIMSNEITIEFNDGTKSKYSYGITYLELCKYYKDKMINPILGVKVNNSVVNLTEKITKDSKVCFFDFNDINGYRMYQAGLKMILITAAKELWGNNTEIDFLNSLDKGIYTKIKCERIIDIEELKNLVRKMQEIIDLDLIFEKYSFNKKEVINYYNQINEKEKATNISRISNSIVTLHKLKNYYSYFYTELPYSTGAINKFELTFIDDNTFVLRYPSPSSNNDILPYTHFPKTLNVFDTYRDWMELINVRYVSDINEIICSNGIKEFIMQNRIVSDEYLSDIIKQIINSDKEIKLICVAGPSSSGKTTTAHRLSLYLDTFGIKSLIMSADNYYKERKDAFVDENGEENYERVESLDVDLLNGDLNKLLNYQEVSMPRFNFITGQKEYNSKMVKIKEGDIIILEGLHCLNDILSKGVLKENKFKIYVSPFTALNIDRHNHLSTIDMRLIRRMVRDNIYRGSRVTDTLEIWQKVRSNEEKYIYPYQNQADAILNTALLYELGVLKVFAEPILYSVPINSKYYEEARRLLGFLRVFFTISPELVPNDCVLREFIGGSIYY